LRQHRRRSIGSTHFSGRFGNHSGTKSGGRNSSRLGLKLTFEQDPTHPGRFGVLEPFSGAPTVFARKVWCHEA
jgi:hypothetical protein